MTGPACNCSMRVRAASVLAGFAINCTPFTSIRNEVLVSVALRVAAALALSEALLIVAALVLSGALWFSVTLTLIVDICADDEVCP